MLLRCVLALTCVSPFGWLVRRPWTSSARAGRSRLEPERKVVTDAALEPERKVVTDAALEPERKVVTDAALMVSVDSRAVSVVLGRFPEGATMPMVGQLRTALIAANQCRRLSLLAPRTPSTCAPAPAGVSAYSRSLTLSAQARSPARW